MAAVLAAACPDLVAAVGVHSGMPAGAARDLPAGLSAMKVGPVAGFEGKGSGRHVPCIVFHGDADATVNCRNADALARAIPHVSTQKTKIDASRARSTAVPAVTGTRPTSAPPRC